MSKDSTEAIYKLLQDRYAGPEWAYLMEVPDGTGQKKQRTADAIAIGLWYKNAGQFHGFEVKSSRSDWQKELQEPYKSQSWRNVVTSFWLVAGRGVAKLQEVPPDWGFLEVATNGESLKIRKQPSHVDRPAVPLNVVGAMLRKGVDTIPHAAREKLRDVDGQVAKAYQNGRTVERGMHNGSVHRIEHLEAVIAEMGKVLGRSPEYLKFDDLTVAIVRAAQNGKLSNIKSSMNVMLRRLEDIRESISGLDTKFAGMIEEFDGIAASEVTDGAIA